MGSTQTEMCIQNIFLFFCLIFPQTHLFLRTHTFPISTYHFRCIKTADIGWCYYWRPLVRVGKLFPMEKTSLSPPGRSPKQNNSAADCWGAPIPWFGVSWPAVGASVLLAGATIGGHKSEWESRSPWKKLPLCPLGGPPNKIFQLQTAGGHQFPGLGYQQP